MQISGATGRDLSRGSLTAHFIHFLTPAVLGMTVVSLYLLIDLHFIGHGVGKAGLAALGFSFPFLGIVYTFNYTIAVGSATIFSIKLGEQKKQDANRIFRCAMTINSLISIALLIPAILFAEPIAHFLGARDEVQQMTADYIRFYFPFITFVMLSGTQNTFIRNSGFPFLSITGLAVGSILNVLLDYLLIMKWGYGIKGAAFATGLSQLVSATIFFVIIRKKGISRGFAPVLPNRFELQRILKNGLPTFFSELSILAMVFLFNWILKLTAGDDGVTVFTMLGNISNFLILLFIGIGQSMQPIAGYNLGAGKNDRARTVYFLGLGAAMLISFAVFLVAMLIPRTVAGFFLDSAGSPEVVAMAVDSFRIAGWAALFMGTNFVSASFFQAIEWSRLSSTIQFLRGIVFTLGCGLILPIFFSYKGVWLAFPIAEGLTFVLTAGWIVKSLKTHKEVNA